MKNWYSIKSKSGDVIDLSIHDEIGTWGISAAEFIADLRKHPEAKSINLSIHSPGGGMVDGFAMHNALRSHPAKVHGHIEGVAASMASVVLMASDTISMPENAFLMIHNPSGGAFGGSDDLRDTADLMDKFKASAMSIYQRRSGLEYDELSTMLDDETWLDGHEAMAKGFIDTVTDSVKIAAKTTIFNKHFKSMPVDVDNNIDGIETIKDFERFLRDSGGISRGLATALSSRAKVLFQGEPETGNDTAFSELSAVLSRIKIPEKL